jgi:hypothetical protein
MEASERGAGKRSREGSEWSGWGAQSQRDASELTPYQ